MLTPKGEAVAIKVISYDLKKPGRNYDDLYKAIKALGSYRHPMDSVWFVDTSLTTSEVYGKLKAYVDSNDLVLVHSWPAYSAGRLPSGTWPWIEEHK